MKRNGLAVEIRKRPDGTGFLHCQRADGSTTWQKQSGSTAAFYALHDLTHFAVETELGYQNGFYGLIAQGWNVEDMTGLGTRGRVPPQALEVESLVGFLDVERASDAIWTAEEFNEQMAGAGRVGARKLSDADLQKVRAARAELFARWRAVPVGESLRLRFEPSSEE